MAKNWLDERISLLPRSIKLATKFTWR